jgi:hypothetical protein
LPCKNLCEEALVSRVRVPGIPFYHTITRNRVLVCSFN